MQLFTLYSKSKACESQRPGRLTSGGEKQPYGEASCLPARHLATTNRLNFSTPQPSSWHFEPTYSPQHLNVLKGFASNTAEVIASENTAME